jgi:RNA-directed DNA polymerase
LTKFNPEKISTGSIASLDNLCSALDIKRSELDTALSLSGADRYKQDSRPKKDGSLRIIYNPHYLIRKIQRRINKRIFSNPKAIRWPDHIFGSIPNQINDNGDHIPKDYISCARFHCGSKSILTIDIKDFFDNIHQVYVEDIFLKFLKFDKKVAQVLADICCLDSHLVQGALTSSYIASLCLWDVEGEIVEKLHYKNLVYTRLVDDINVSSKVSDYDFSYVMRVIEEMTTKKGLQLNHKKTCIQYISTRPLTVHGLRVAFKEPRLPSDEVRKIRSAVKNIETLASERDYRTSHAYRKDFNRCMGRVNKLIRIGHNQHANLLARLKKIFPLPSKKDIERTKKIIERLEADNPNKQDTYWYWRRYYLAHERLNIVQRTFPSTAKELRNRMSLLRPKYV